MNKIQIWSPSLVHHVALELIQQAHCINLPPEIRYELELAVNSSSPDTLHPLLKQFKISVDLQPLHLLSMCREESEKRQLAMRFCIGRHAHFPLLKQLFDATSKEVVAVRKEINGTLPPRYAVNVPDRDMWNMWRDWLSIKAEFSQEVDQWVVIAQRYPSYALSTLYRVLVIEVGETQ